MMATSESVHIVKGERACMRYIRCATVVGVRCAPSCSMSVICDLLSGEQLLRETEAAHVRHPHRVQDAIEVVHLVLHDSRVEALGHAVDLVPPLVEAGI